MVIILFCLTVACEDDDGGWKVGEMASIGFMGKAELKNTPLSVSLSELVKDSRCPSDVDCVDIGQAEVLIVITEEGEIAGELNLTLRQGKPEMASGVFGDFKFTLLDILPYPDSRVTVSDEGYTMVIQADPI